MHRNLVNSLPSALVSFERKRHSCAMTTRKIVDPFGNTSKRAATGNTAISPKQTPCHVTKLHLELSEFLRTIADDFFVQLKRQTCCQQSYAFDSGHVVYDDS